MPTAILQPLNLRDDNINPALRERRPRFIIVNNGNERLTVEGKRPGNPSGISSLGSTRIRHGEVALESLK